MANCSITTIVESSGFLRVFVSIPIKKVVFFAFSGGVFAGGGWDQWSVVGGQWSVEAAIFFVGKF
jgi:hypothetical protein